MSAQGRSKLNFPMQILTTGAIVLALAGAARLASSQEDSRAFDEAAEETRLLLEGAGRGIERAGETGDGATRRGP